MKKEILGVSIDDVTLPEAVSIAAELVREPGWGYVVTPNPEFLLDARKNEAFRRDLAGAALTVPDGIGVVYAAKILGTPLKGRVPGIELAGGLMAEMAKWGGRVYLLGAKPGVATRAGEKLMERYPGLVVCGARDGYFKEEESHDIAREIAQSGADAVFVCLGAPKQERWMACYGSQTGARLLLGLGGSLDVFAGTVERAPELWRKLNLEWLYRLVKEPKRWKRMARLPLVLLYALGERLRGD